jgi:capsular exopolysaccharide synthesis family protein
MARTLLNKRARNKKESGDLSERLITVLDPTSEASEAYRDLRASLLYARIDKPPKVIVITSPSLLEGKSTTCANLGVVLAQADKRTLIMDCDLRRPTMHKIFGLENLNGVVDVVAGEYDLSEVCQEPLRGLKVSTTGLLPPNPAEFVGSRQFAKLLGQVRQTFAYVLIDAPPIVSVSDAAVLAAQGDGVLLVIDAQHTRKSSLRQAMRSLEAVDASVLGTVMNNVKEGKGGYY